MNPFFFFYSTAAEYRKDPSQIHVTAVCTMGTARLVSSGPGRSCMNGLGHFCPPHILVLSPLRAQPSEGCTALGSISLKNNRN